MSERAFRKVLHLLIPLLLSAASLILIFRATNIEEWYGTPVTVLMGIFTVALFLYAMAERD